MGIRVLTLVLLVLSLLFVWSRVEAATVGGGSLPASERPLTTYERFLPLAVAGDPAIQHFLGYMFFYGEGVELSYDEAHYWFHLAAEEGDSRAQRNLGIFHARAIARIPARFYDAGEANLWFSLAAANPENPATSALAAKSYDRFLNTDTKQLSRVTSGQRPGEFIYQSSCAGCHGFDGQAAYAAVPSFARGERLERSDRRLVDSILQGEGAMQPWGKSLSPAAARDIVGYIRLQFGQESVRKLSPEVAIANNQQLALGEEIYLMFCGGCHGFNGIAWYVNSPSFALSERMEKSNEELTNSIKKGLGTMPSWENMLRPRQIDALVQFIRSLAKTYDAGIDRALYRPEQFLRFRPKGETGPNWTADDLR